jgi:hypothetical protein
MKLGSKRLQNGEVLREKEGAMAVFPNIRPPETASFFH